MIVSTTAVLNAPGGGLVLNADESSAYITRPYVDDLIMVDTATGISTTIEPDQSHGRVVLDPSEDYAYVSAVALGKIWKIDLSDNSRVELVSGLVYPYALAINATGTTLYTTVGAVGEPGDFDLYAISLPGGAATRITTIEDSMDAPGDITLSNDGNYIYVYDQYGSRIGAGVWRVDVNPVSPDYGQVVAMARWLGEMLQGRFTPDGNHLVMTNAHRHQIIDLCLSDDCIPLAAGFSAAPVWGYTPLEVAFYNNSQGDYSASLWDFGDVITSSLPSPTHTFRTAGVYTVTLTVSGPGGSDQEMKESCIQVYSKIYLPLVIKN